jgi:hypothetical protein
MKYIQNTHNAPITVHGRDGKGAVLFTKKFMPEKADKWTGQVMSTGYTELTDEEFESLEKTSRTFAVYTGKTGKAELLVVCDELPPEAKTPHEALVDARKEARKSAGKIAELDGEIVKLKASLLDAETRYKQLQSASGAEEAVKLLQDENTKLKENLETVTLARDAAATELAAVKSVLAEKLGEKSGKGNKSKDFD